VARRALADDALVGIIGQQGGYLVFNVLC